MAAVGRLGSTKFRVRSTQSVMLQTEASSLFLWSSQATASEIRPTHLHSHTAYKCENSDANITGTEIENNQQIHTLNACFPPVSSFVLRFFQFSISMGFFSFRFCAPSTFFSYFCVSRQFSSWCNRNRQCGKHPIATVLTVKLAKLEVLRDECDDSVCLSKCFHLAFCFFLLFHFHLLSFTHKTRPGTSIHLAVGR